MKIVLMALLSSAAAVSLNDVRKMLDRGLNEVKALQETKLYIYQRIKRDISKQNTIQLNYGLNNETFVTQLPIQFKIDLEFPNVLINMNTRGCSEEDGCVKVANSSSHENTNYQGTPYTYFNAFGFLAFNRIRPGELSIASPAEVKNFYSLPIRFYDNSEQMQSNVLGLAPNSDLWKYWASLYHFPGRRINLSFIYKQDQPFIMFDSAIDPEKEILFQVKRSSSSYHFPAKYSLTADDVTKTNEDISVCIANQVDQTFRISDNLFHAIKKAICKVPNDCGKVSSLNQDPNFSLQISMKDYKRADANFTSTFFLSSLYKINGEDIVWKIDKTTAAETAAGCQLVLEQNFLIEKQLLISYSLDNPDELLVGFRLLDPSDFSKLNFYSIIMVLMLLLTVSLVVIYVIMNHSLNKLLKKENLA